MKRALLAILILAALAVAEPKGGFVVDNPPFPWSHSPTLLEAKNGDLLAAWFGGVDKIVPNRKPEERLSIWLSRRTAKGWSAPQLIVREPGTDSANPVLFRSKDGVTWLSYKFGAHANTWSGGYVTSNDDGKTWSSPRHLPAGLLGPIKNKPLILDDGTILAGSSVETHGAWAVWVERSTDNGRTWTKHGPVVHPKYAVGVIQPAIVPISRNRLRMFMRARRVGFVCYSDSSDGGKTWGEVRETSLPNPDSGIDAVALKDGRIVMIYNDSNHNRKRWPINLAVADANGENWEPFLVLESEPGVYAYPAIIQTSDGNIHVAYAYNKGNMVSWTPDGASGPLQRLSGGTHIKHVEVPLKDVPQP